LNNHLNQGRPIPKPQRVFRVIFTCCWAGLIFYLSSGTFGGRFSGLVLSTILHVLHLHVTPPSFELLHHLFRKSAHLTEYCIFGLLIFATIQGRDDLYWDPRIALWSVLLAGSYSLTDEFHQIFVPGRGPSLRDCGLDTAAAVLGMLLIWGATRIREKSRQTAEAATTPLPN
jgi:VanZ family protein